MKKHLPAFLILLSFFSGRAQIDTSFWFVAPKVPAAIGITSVSLQFATFAQSATIIVSQPANPSGVNFSLTLPANTSTVINVTASLSALQSTLANQADNKGLYIRSNNKISANYNIESPVSKESISLKGTAAMGDDFYAPFPNNINTLKTGTVIGNVAFDVVATEPGLTTVIITPRGNLIGPRAKDISFVTTLTQGQTFSNREGLINNNIPRDVVAQDFNNDSKIDIAIIDQQFNWLFIFLGDGAGNFIEMGYYQLGSLPTKVIAADVNADLNQDLIVTNSGSNNIGVFLGNGNGTFQAPGTFTTGSTPVSVVCADFNADSNKDLAVVNSGANNISILTGNGTGNFTFLASYTVGTGPTDIASADFNADGKPDIAVTNGGSNNVSVLTATVPAGTFTTTGTYNVQNGPSSLVTGNFNTDTRIDIAVANRNSNSVSILRNIITATVSPGTFMASLNYACGVTPVSIVSATINGDANLDLAVANYSANTVSVLLGSPTATMSAAVANNVGYLPFSLATADFNSDNQPDFVTADFGYGTYTKLFGNGTNNLGPMSNVLYGTTKPSVPSLLAGSIVSADKKVAVTISGALESATTCASFYADQITNSTKTGMDYVIHKSNTQNDVAYILAPLNSTSLSITSSTVTNFLINSGETFTVNTSANPSTYIKTDKPVYVFNLAGNSCKLGGAQIAPAYCAGSYTAGFTRMSADSLFLQVYTRAGYQNTFTLEINSTPTSIAASAFSVVPGTSNNLVFARINYPISTIPVGANCILKNSQDLFGLSIQNLSSTSGNLFSQVSEFSSSTFVFANSITTASICANTSFTLNGLVGGGPNTGMWTYNGFGTLSGGNTQLVNNVYTPNPIDTNIKPVKIVLTTTGNCPNKSDTLKLTIKQAPIVNAGFDIVTCTNNPTVQLNGNVLGPTNQGVWSVVNPGTGSFVPGVNSFTSVYNLSNSDTALTQIKIVLTSTNNPGCNNVTDTMRIIVNKAPLVKSSNVKPLVKCANNSNVFLNGSITGTTTSTGSWTTTGTGYFTPNNLSLICNYVPSLSDIATGTVSLKLTSTAAQTCKEVSDSVLVIFTQPVTVSTGVDLNSCKNNPATALNAIITGTATNTGIWSGGGGLFSPSASVLNPTYTATSSEINAGFVVLTFTTTNNGICNGVSDQVRIDFREKPIANFTVNAVCLNQNTLFTDQSINPAGIGSITNWNWDFGDGITSTTVSPVHTYSLAGTYTTQLVISSNFGCTDTLVKPVTVKALPTAGMAVSRVCSGSSQQITFNDQSSIAAPGTVTGYYWDFGGFGFSNAMDTVIIFPSEGNYNITHVVTSSGGCQSTITQSINVTPKPQAKFLYITSNNQALETNVTFIDSSKAAVNWNWNFGNNTTSNVQNPVAIYNANGSYTVSLTITDQFGCSDTYSAVVRISNIVSEIAQLIPNFISPNNDGKNDLWRLDFINVYYPKAEIEIFNRWGESLFKSTGYSNAWDGSYKGNPLPVGAYYYTISLNDSKDDKVYKGTVTLIK